MKKILIPLILLSIIVSFCGEKMEVVKLEKDTPAYQLAQDLAQKIPFLDPDSNKVLVKSNEFNITTGELINSFYDNSGKNSEQFKQMPVNQLKGTILQSVQAMGERRLVVSEAEKANFTVSQSVMDSLLNMQYSRMGGEQEFLERLEEIGANKDAVIKDIRNYILFDRYLDEMITNQIQISDEQIQTAYDEYTGKENATVRHILLLTQGKSDAEKQEIRKKMKDILDRAKAGEDFAELAREYTEDPGSKENGGLYEEFTKGQMVKPFEEASFSVPVGEISDIVETQYGYHILKVIARNTYKTLEEYKPEIEMQLKNQKKPQGYRDFMAKLKQDYEYEEVKF